MPNLLDDNFYSLQNVLREYLDADERIIWQGTPQQGIRVTKKDSYLIPFSILWGGFAIFWEFMAVSMGAPFFFALFGIPFVVIGLYLMVGRFFLDAYFRKYTIYALTNKRILIKTGNKSHSIKSYYLDSLPNLELTEEANGLGSILFINPSQRPKNQSAFHTSGSQLDSIENPRYVYNQIQQLKKMEG